MRPACSEGETARWSGQRSISIRWRKKNFFTSDSFESVGIAFAGRILGAVGLVHFKLMTPPRPFPQATDKNSIKRESIHPSAQSASVSDLPEQPTAETMGVLAACLLITGLSTPSRGARPRPCTDLCDPLRPCCGCHADPTRRVRAAVHDLAERPIDDAKDCVGDRLGGHGGGGHGGRLQGAEARIGANDRL